MHSDAVTVEGYLAELPDDRRQALEAVRHVILDHLPEGYEEVMQYGMISYVVPLSTYPDTYNGQALAVASLANQKHHMAVYLMGVYGDDGSQDWLREQWAATGKKLDMGKSCLRFKRARRPRPRRARRGHRPHLGRRLHRRLRALAVGERGVISASLGSRATLRAAPAHPDANSCPCEQETVLSGRTSRTEGPARHELLPL